VEGVEEEEEEEAGARPGVVSAMAACSNGFDRVS
jgi:hypothetical protein